MFYNLQQVGGNTMKSFIESLYYGEISPLHIEAQLECEADFERGFRLGAELMLEVLKD